ncbi:MAG: isoprenylcysteine carboxylmethyltransferase family protein [Gemmatimonadales bacterium]
MLALLAHYRHPARIVAPGVAVPVGLGLLGLGVAVAVAAVRRLHAARTTLQPWESTTTLVTSGPFRYTRNPIYLSYTLLYLGVTFCANSVWPLLLLPLVLGLVILVVIGREERYLEARFGDAYQDYRRRVRRWL